MPYMVAPMAYMPVGVVRSPSTLWSLKPLPPRRIGIGGSAGRQYPLTFWNVSSVPVVTPYPLAYATITWVVPAGRVCRWDARVPGTGWTVRLGRGTPLGQLSTGGFERDGTGDGLSDGDTDGLGTGSCPGAAGAGAAGAAGIGAGWTRTAGPDAATHRAPPIASPASASARTPNATPSTEIRGTLTDGDTTSTKAYRCSGDTRTGDCAGGTRHRVVRVPRAGRQRPDPADAARGRVRRQRPRLDGRRQHVRLQLPVRGGERPGALVGARVRGGDRRQHGGEPVPVRAPGTAPGRPGVPGPVGVPARHGGPGRPAREGVRGGRLALGG